MKFKIQFKTLSGVSDCVNTSVRESLPGGLTEDGAAVLAEERHNEVDAVLEKWLRYSEYITIEFDTDTKTATVCEAKP
jgi:hypothetical protein